MADETTIWVAGVTAFATLISGWGGYWLAGRNSSKRWGHLVGDGDLVDGTDEG
jgi:hypothetical protein